MKQLYIIIALLLLAIGNGWAQGSDVIICIDNSGSVDNTEYTNMSNSIHALVNNILSCNPSNRVSVVHYGANDAVTPQIYIETNFINNAALANSFVRRLSAGDYYHESLGLIGNALDNVTNAPIANILSPQRQLTRTAGNSLVVFLFTDAIRSGGSSYLVNFNNPTVGSNAAFQNFTSFKTVRGAKFVVVHVNADVASQKAAASIASRGGSYTGALEGYPLDPDGNNLPRFYLNNNFVLTTAQINAVSSDICTISIVASIMLNPVNENCPLFPLSVTGSFNIPGGATITNITLQVLNSSGTVVSTLTAPSVSGNTFSFPVNLANFGTASPMTGNFEFKVTATVTQGSTVTTITSTSANAGADVSFSNCSVCCADCCVDNQSLASPVLANYMDTRQANLRIHAANVINNGAFASYHAGELVLLKDGFVALAGSRLHAYIAGCTNDYTLRETLQDSGERHYTVSDWQGIDPNKVQEPITQSDQISISPNPTSGLLRIKLTDAQDGTLEVSNLSGNLVYKREFKNQSQFEINLQEQPKGVYVVKVFSDKHVYSEKIIKN